MHYHYIFGTYKNKSSLIDKGIRDFLSNEFRSIAEEKALIIVACSILEDHVHMLIEQSDNDDTNYVMRMIKGISARKLFKKYATNRLEYRKLWSRGYYSRIIPEHEIGIVIKYISTQTDSKGIDKRYNRRGSPEFVASREVHSQVSYAESQ